MDLDPDNMTPMWRQLADVIAGRIADGTYPAGKRIPSEADFMAEAGISRATVRKALSYLAEEEQTVTVMGKGTFVKHES